MRVIFVPQYPTPMRYQEWWFTYFPDMLRYHGFEVLTLGERAVGELKVKAKTGLFAPITPSVLFETEQIKEYMHLPVRKDDILFMADISFPGFFPQILYHKRPDQIYGFCHATSLNYRDYFEFKREQKWPTEKAIMELCHKVFVGSNYHKKKLGLANTVVAPLPFPNMKESLNANRLIADRKNNIISVSRIGSQKVDDSVEYDVKRKFSDIRRQECYSWHEYYEFLADSKIMLITSREETFGYQVVDGILNGCIVLAPNMCSYPELLNGSFLYDSNEELIDKITRILSFNTDVRQQLICKEQMKNFFTTLTEVMRP